MPGKNPDAKVGSFEEHFNIAIETAMIHPKVFSYEFRESYLSRAKERFILLGIFYDAAVAYAKDRKGSLTDLAENILEQIKAKQ